MNFLRIPVHIEAVVKPQCDVSISDLKNILQERIKLLCAIFKDGELVFETDDSLSNYFVSIRVSDLGYGKLISFWQAELLLHVYRVLETEPEKDFLEGEESLPACEQWEIPNSLLTGLWDSIIMNENLKHRLLSYCDSSLMFSEAKVDSSLISWNRIILLHGPPGTGKTTLCKALAQKVYIRNMELYESGVLLEINAHSLFSRWFSESGKLVMKLFEHVTEIAEDEKCFVAVLIDEVESMVSARSASIKGNEPSDAVRVVNAVLTSLDDLRRRPNVLILCTSNLLTSIDQAFLDRLDMRVYLGPPPIQARYRILHSCLVELMDRGIIRPRQNLTYALDVSSASEMEAALRDQANGTPYENWTLEMKLLEVAHLCEGSSGRGLRKLPLKAHAFFLQRSVVTLEDFILAMKSALRDRLGEDIGEGEDI